MQVISLPLPRSRNVFVDLETTGVSVIHKRGNTMSGTPHIEAQPGYLEVSYPDGSCVTLATV